MVSHLPFSWKIYNVLGLSRPGIEHLCVFLWSIVTKTCNVHLIFLPFLAGFGFFMNPESNNRAFLFKFF